MRETFYGLIREYLTATRDRDVCKQEAKVAPEGVEKEQANRKLELVHKRCLSLRRQIKRYPNVGSLTRGAASNNPGDRYMAQAG